YDRGQQPYTYAHVCSHIDAQGVTPPCSIITAAWLAFPTPGGNARPSGIMIAPSPVPAVPERTDARYLLSRYCATDGASLRRCADVSSARTIGAMAINASTSISRPR